MFTQVLFWLVRKYPTSRVEISLKVTFFVLPKLVAKNALSKFSDRAVLKRSGFVQA